MSLRIGICFLVLLLFVTGCTGNDHINYLSYQTYPLDAHGVLTYDGRDYEVLVSVGKAGDLKLQIVLPSSIAGMVFEVRDGVTYLTYNTIETELKDGGYASAEGILLASQMFSLNAKSYDGAGVTTVNGIRYSYAKYNVPDGTVRVYIPDGQDLPDRIEAELNGHTFSFQFMNET